MPNASFLLAINLAVAAMFAGSFLCIAALDRKHIAPRWFAVGCVATIGYLLCEFALAVFGINWFRSIATFTAFFVSLIFMNIGLAQHYSRPISYLLIVPMLLTGITINVVSFLLPHQSFASLLLYQLPFAAMQLIGAAIVLPRSEAKPLDLTLGWLLAASALHFMAKPWIAVATGANESANRYVETTYALFSQSLGTILGTAIALLLIFLSMRKLLAQMADRAQRDSLSGLLNRGGFQERVVEALALSRVTGTPASLIVCDLDHFKSINDSYGHVYGDQVIAEFGTILSEVTGPNATIGRIGGEEFAIYLQSCNLAEASGVAEEACEAFQALRMEGVASALHLSASFGVIEVADDEDALSAMCRADKAMYLAKADGRGCVRSTDARTANPLVADCDMIVEHSRQGTGQKRCYLPIRPAC